MALPVNIDDLINARTVESVRIEFKRGWNPEDIIHSVCAFANDIKEYGSGYIIVGIEENNGVPILPPFGVQDDQIDKIQKEFLGLCHQIQPNIFPVIEPILFQGKYIIVIWVTAGEERPYTAPSTLGAKAQRKIYVRPSSSSIQASPELEAELQALSTHKHFDDRINTKATLNDLDLGLILSYLQEIKSQLYTEAPKIPFEELCLKMQIARGQKENIKPLNVGLLMFCKDPHRFFEGCKTNLIEFEDEAGIKYSEKIFSGPVHIQIRDIMNYLSSNVIKQHVKKSSSKAESDIFYNYPYQALEEVIVNAMYHRSYQEARPNEIRIHKFFKKGIGEEAQDSRRIEIRSYPGPLPPIDNNALLQLRFASRNYRNIKLGDWLKNIRLAEKYATGIPTILETLSNNGSPKPIFWTDDSKSEFLVVIKIHEDSPTNGYPPELEVERTILTNQQQQILEIIRQEPISERKIKKRFSQDITTDIEFLQKNGFIGSQKSWLTTLFFSTPKGLEALKGSF